MKIVILVWQFPPKWLAGTELATYDIAKHLALRGHEVHVITSLDQGLCKESIEKGFNIHRIRFNKIRLIGTILFWLAIISKIRKVNPDIVHAQGIGISIPAFMVKLFLNKPYSIWCQGSDIYLPWNFKRPISKIVFHFADAVIAYSENMKKEIQKISKRDVHIISNGIDLQLFSNLTREQARSDLQIIKDQQIITFVGTLRPVKGVKYLIRAMDIVVRRKADIRLILIGDGPDRHELEGMTKDLILGNQITFIGKVPHEKVPEFMVASDIFILPSLSEGLPGVIIEAFAAAIPIVATSVGALPEIIREGENGFLVEPKNPEQLAEKILLLLGNSELRNKFSENNKLKSKNYTWDCVVDLLEQRFIDITRKHHLPPLKDHV